MAGAPFLHGQQFYSWIIHVVSNVNRYMCFWHTVEKLNIQHLTIKLKNILTNKMTKVVLIWQKHEIVTCKIDSNCFDIASFSLFVMNGMVFNGTLLLSCSASSRHQRDRTKLQGWFHNCQISAWNFNKGGTSRYIHLKNKSSVNEHRHVSTELLTAVVIILVCQTKLFNIFTILKDGSSEMLQLYIYNFIFIKICCYVGGFAVK